MSHHELNLHICDDWISCGNLSADFIHSAAASLSGQPQWHEIVPGIDNIAVQFDPAALTPAQAAALLRDALAQVTVDHFEQVKKIEIPICYDPIFAPDRDYIADKLGLPASDIASWHSGLDFRVAILGFMPGFAYLACDQDISEIGRLAQPRSRVAAGSVGIIGQQSCLYPFDSPGGWPIIGRSPLKLFDPAHDPAALLHMGQRVSFRPIDRDEFHRLEAGA